jgi:hypothetical protein
MFRKIMIGSLALGSALSSCGKKDSKKNSEDDPNISTGSLALNYAMAALGSSQKSPSATSLVSTDADLQLLDAEVQSTKFPDCSNQGRPWDRNTNALMSATSSAYAQGVLYCQSNIEDTPDTIAGSMALNKNILCAVEKGLGTIEYTSDGKVYADAPLVPTLECGFTQSQINEIGTNNKATITAKSYASGDWQRSLRMQIATFKIDITLFMTAKSGKVAVKFIESWDADARGDGASAGVASGTKGTRGSVISIDRTNGILRAEYADTYWGRRSRLYSKGTLDSSTGKFSSTSELSGVFLELGLSNGTSIWGNYATVKGTATDGFKYNSAQISQSGSSLSSPTFTTGSPRCVPTSGCSGNSGITLTATAADLKFMSVGAGHDAYNQTRAAFQTWIDAAGDLTFTEFAPTLSP